MIGRVCIVAVSLLVLLDCHMVSSLSEVFSLRAPASWSSSKEKSDQGHLDGLISSVKETALYVDHLCVCELVPSKFWFVCFRFIYISILPARLKVYPVEVRGRYWIP